MEGREADEEQIRSYAAAVSEQAAVMVKVGKHVVPVESLTRAPKPASIFRGADKTLIMTDCKNYLEKQQWILVDNDSCAWPALPAGRPATESSCQPQEEATAAPEPSSSWAEEMDKVYQRRESGDDSCSESSSCVSETDNVMTAGSLDPCSPETHCVMPTATLRSWVKGRSGQVLLVLCLLDSGASRSFISLAAAKKLGARLSRKRGPIKVAGIGGAQVSIFTVCLVIGDRQGNGWQRELEFRCLPHMGSMNDCPVEPELLGVPAWQLADLFPKTESQNLDVILGQDVLWDIYVGSPTRLVSPETRLMLYPTKFGIVVGGIIHGAGVSEEDARMILGEVPLFHLLHPRRLAQEGHEADTEGEELVMIAHEGLLEDHAAELLPRRVKEEQKRARKEMKQQKEDELVTLTRRMEAFMKYESLGMEAPEVGDGLELTALEQYALESIKNSLTFIDGKYYVGLTFAPERPPLQNNRFQALKRLEAVERSFKRTEGLQERYEAAIQEFIDNQDIEKVEEEGPSGKTFYLPHKAVIREDKTTTKTRVVFDGSARDSNGVSLNDCLLKGPAGKQDLLKILINFRWNKVAFSGDVKRMFLCIGVHEKDRDHLRFLWRDKQGQIVTYRFKNVTFGLRDAPFVAQEVFKTHAQKYAHKYSMAVDILLNKRWVDDLLTSLPTIKMAGQVMEQIKDVMLEGGFPVKKWVSSEEEALAGIPEEDRLGVSTAIRIQGSETWDGLSTEERVSALGMSWVVSHDYFCIAGADQEMVGPGSIITKRVVTSKVAGIFDPMGLVAPFLMGGKRLIKQCWLTHKKESKEKGLKGNDLMRFQKQTWDHELPDSISTAFRNWQSQVNLLKQFKVDRCLILKDKQVKERQLHVFGDASPFGCSAAAYCRTEYMDGTVTAALINSKTRVAPSEDSGEEGQGNLPRLELVAAVTAKRLAARILEDHQEMKTTFWTDSSVAHQWIKTGVLDKKVWVANRVREILETTAPSQWRHIPGTDNPADLGTRGISVTDLLQSKLWLHGPSWLVEDEKLWPQRQFTLREEEKKEFDEGIAAAGSKHQLATLMATQAADGGEDLAQQQGPQDCLARIRSKASSLSQVIGITNLFKFKSRREGLPAKTPERIRYILGCHIKQVQWQHFQGEIEALQQGLPVPKSSSVVKAGVILDGEGFLRAKGRVPVSARQVAPLVMPKKDSLTRMLMEDAHWKCSHQGAGWTRYLFAKYYWCPNMVTLARSVVRSCVLCQRLHSSAVSQSVGDLPPWRLEEKPRPFSYVGVDYAGPLWCFRETNSSDKRKKYRATERDKKLYIVLFTCMQIRAVHFEVVESMAVEPLNMAVRRFMARKGKPRVFYSDNAKSFHKLSEEMELLNELHSSKGVRKALQDEGIRWLFMPERAPWWGGLHERMVKTMKEVLRVTLRGRYTEEEVTTFVVEAEGLVNSRPLGRVDDDAGEPLPVTPSELLLGYNVDEAPLPTVPTQGKDTEIKRVWARRQHLMQLCRRRFVKDYLQLLRSYRQAQQPNDQPVKTGDLVLYDDGASKRAQWPLGRVVETFVGRDGLIRAATIKTAKGETRRPVQKLVKLEITGIQDRDDDAEEIEDLSRPAAVTETAEEQRDDAAADLTEPTAVSSPQTAEQDASTAEAAVTETKPVQDIKKIKNFIRAHLSKKDDQG